MQDVRPSRTSTFHCAEKRLRGVGVSGWAQGVASLSGMMSRTMGGVARTGVTPRRVSVRNERCS